MATFDYTGGVEALSARHLSGWIKLNLSDDSLTIGIVIDGEIVGLDLAADVHRSDLLEGDISTGRYGFHAKFDRPLEVGHTARVEIWDKNAGAIALLEHVQVEPYRSTAEYVGSVDNLSDHSINGWVKHASSDESLIIDVIVDGVVVAAEIVADDYRSDLAEAGIGSGHYGFDVPVGGDAKLSAGRPCEIAIRDRGGNCLALETQSRVEIYRGGVDVISSRLIKGWAAMEFIDEPVVIDVLVDNIVVASDVIADAPTADGFPEAIRGNHGFVAVIKPELAHDRISRVMLIEKRAGQTIFSADMMVQRPHRGNIDAIVDGRVEGWVVAVGSPDPVLVNVIVNGDLAKENILADGHRSDLDDVGVGRHAFVFPLEDALLERGPCAIEIREAATGELLLQRDFEAAASDDSPVSQEASSFDGRVERLRPDELAGWAIDFRTLSPAKVKLLIDGLHVADTEADKPRADVANLFPDYKASGFSFALPPGLLDDAECRVTVRVAGTRHHLPHTDSFTAALQQLQQTVHHGHAPHSNQLRTTIIVPVYNAAAELRECLRSVLQHTPLNADLCCLSISDDASPDPAVTEILRGLDGREAVRAHRNAARMGYTRNINEAIRRADRDSDIILLNSDAVVTPRWLHYLRAAAYRQPWIGTVTAVSDNAGSFSVPERNESNPAPPWLDRESQPRLVAQASRHSHPAVATGSGFCMYIRRELLDRIGLFDNETFAKGYGEENDFCMRAIHAGWSNVVCEEAFIYHRRAASFQGERDKLIDRAATIIAKSYPEYPLLVQQSFGPRSRLASIRFRIRQQQLRRIDQARPRLLSVVGVRTGGTPETNMDLMAKIQHAFEPYVLESDTRRVRLFAIFGRQRVLVEERMLSDPVNPITHDSPSYAEFIDDLLQDYGFELIHVRQIGRHGLSLLSGAAKLDIPIVFSFHDFYAVCPNVKLLDPDNVRCRGVCTPGTDQDCNVELWNRADVPPLRNKWIRNWQSRFGQVLEQCSAFITTSPTVHDVLTSIYAAVGRKPFFIVPHARDLPRSLHAAGVPKRGDRLKILAPGHLVAAKGLDLIKAIKRLDTDDEIEFHFLGTAAEPLDRYGVVHGSYIREDFAAKAAEIRPHIGLVLSIWDESYSHVLTELWSCGIPVMTTEFGALGERLNQHGGGWILKDLSAPAIYDFALELARNPDEIIGRSQEVARWQLEFGSSYTPEAMAYRYIDIYRQVLRSDKPLRPRVWVISLAAERNDLRSASYQHLTTVLAEMTGHPEPDIDILPLAVLGCLDQMPEPDVIVLQFDGRIDVKKDIAAKLLSIAGRTKFVLDFLTNSAEAALDRLQASSLADLCKRAAKILTSVPASDCALTQGDKTIFAAAPESYSRVIDEMYLASYVSSGLAHVETYNRSFIAANFTLINWAFQFALARDRKAGASIVIPSHNRADLTRRMVESIFLSTSAPDFEIIIVNNGSDADSTRQINACAGIDRRIRAVHPGQNLMFAAGCNYGASFARFDHVVFLNNDMEAINSTWLSKLIEPLREDPAIGAVGGRLLYRDGTLQHAGIVFGENNKVAYHIYKGMPGGFGPATRQRIFQAVTGACMAVRATDFIKLRGFNPVFVNGMEDIDFCLRMKIVLERSALYMPEATLIHDEGQSPGRSKHNLRNRRHFIDMWSTSLIRDDSRYYEEDGVKLTGYATDEPDAAPEIRANRALIDA